MAIDYVICAAGAGSRMMEINPSVAKPLLKLGGKTLLERSLESLDLFPGDRLIILSQKDHGLRAAMETTLATRYSFCEIHWIEIQGLTRGQLETALLARPVLNPDHGVVIFNCDTFFRSRNLTRKLSESGIDAIIPCSREEGDSWSFCAVAEDRDGAKVLEVVEKVRISHWCSVGYYHFRTARLFLELADRYMRLATAGELYVAPMYQLMIEEGHHVVLDVVDTFKPMGSLSQLLDYWQADRSALRRENPLGTLVVDIDGTLTIDEPGVSYPHKRPRLDVIAKLRDLHEQGFEIVLHTARRMRTHQNDEAKLLADIAQPTLDWLHRHDVPFDGIKFGKPYAQRGFYLDDRAIRPTEFLAMDTSEIEAMLTQEAGFASELKI